MSSNDEREDPDWDRADPSAVIGIAEGILIERYHIPGPMASALLESFATAADMSVIDAARWLLSTGRLP
ncbi:hypothetical protein ABZX12_28940 [Kribbella sp. NPDC003505]|uniref:hypothetical protein n=1 Tax=Kribbella sp. NPDC003505 TaxID=3154448 RepID=UPI0033B3E5B2